MKKILFLAVMAVVAFFASCSNKEIEVGYALNVKVDPSEVVAPFVPWNTGDLDACPSGNVLRVHVFAYNAEGVLKGSAVSYINNYGSIASADLHLPVGMYTLIAVTDVVKGTAQKTSTEYWSFSGEDNITSLKVSKTQWIANQRGILGVASGKLNVTSQNSSFLMKPKAAGALIVSAMYNIHHYSVNEYQLAVNRNSDFLSFSSEGTYIPSVKNNNNSFDWRIHLVDPKNYADYNGAYAYAFLLPVSNMGFRYEYKYTSGGTTQRGYTGSITLTLKAGEEYLMELDMYDSEENNEITFNAYTINTNSSSRKGGDFVESLGPNQFNMNRWGSGVETQSANIIDLIDTVE